MEEFGEVVPCQSNPKGASDESESEDSEDLLVRDNLAGRSNPPSPGKPKLHPRKKSISEVVVSQQVSFNPELIIKEISQDNSFGLSVSQIYKPEKSPPPTSL